MNEPKKISKRAHLSPVCKINGCGKTTMARGMCNSHYQAWRRVHNAPLAKTRDDTKKLILSVLPATRRKIEQETGFHFGTVMRYLPDLRREKLMYIDDYEPPVNGGNGRWQPVYAVGNKKDKVLTKERRREYRQRHATERKEKELQTVVRKPKSKWGKPAVSQQNPFSALGL